MPPDAGSPPTRGSAPAGETPALSPGWLPPQLELARFRLQYKVAERARFPADKAQLLRRGLVAALRAGMCLEEVARAPQASAQSPPGEPARSSCPLQWLPLPFAYSPPTDARTWYYTAESWTAHLVLIGAAQHHARCFIRALDHQVRHRWPAAGSARVLLEQVDMLDPRDQQHTSFYFTRERQQKSRVIPYDATTLHRRAALLGMRDRITLRLLTPLRAAHPLPADAAAWLGLLAHRLLQAARCCLPAERAAGSLTPSPPATPPPRPAWSDILVDDRELSWSQRPTRTWEAQGSIVLHGTLQPWFAALIAGQHLNLGDGAALGFGRYELRP